MYRTLSISLLVFSLLFLFISCSEAPRELGRDGWLHGTTDEMLEILADQFGGFDQTMIEVGYRYVELYWGGQDENWQYVLYQLDEMTGALEKGFLRRPGRRESAEMFMNYTLPELTEAAENANQALFWDRFNSMTSNCNSCHVNEDVGYMYVQPPEYRYSPITKAPAN